MCFPLNISTVLLGNKLAHYPWRALCIAAAWQANTLDVPSWKCQHATLRVHIKTKTIMAVTRQIPIIKSIKAPHSFPMKEERNSQDTSKLPSVNKFQSDTLCIVLPTLISRFTVNGRF